MIERLAILTPPDAESRRLGLAHGALSLRRAWPRSSDHLLLEYIDQSGTPVVGQWMRDGSAISRIAAATAKRCPDTPCGMITTTTAEVFLQPHGADRRLSSLDHLCQTAGASLLSHRPERRAVVRLQSGAETRFAKLLLPAHAQRVLAAHARLCGAPHGAVTLPKVLHSDTARGLIIWSKLDGRSLDELFDGSPTAPAAAAGAALAWLHAQDPVGLSVHGAAEEVELLRQRCGQVAGLVRGLRFDGMRERVTRSLQAASSAHVTLHRDFYDKQIMIAPDGAVGLLDFDTMAAGEAALDVANMLAHLELRQLQGRCSAALAASLAGAFLDAYRPAPALVHRVNAYLDSARLRLCCVYALRPRWAHLPAALLERIGAAAPGDCRRSSRSDVFPSRLAAPC